MGDDDGGAGGAGRKSRACFWFMFLLVQIFGLTLVILIAVWLGKYLGGFAWDHGAREFNIHPLCMVLSLLYLFGTSALIYRLFPNLSKFSAKIIHASLNGLVLVGVTIGLIAVFQFQNAFDIKNLYSLHSWCGLTTIILFFIQYVVGFSSFLFPGFRDKVRASIIPYHYFFGIAILILAGITAISGITENLIYTLPGKLYQNLPTSAVLGNCAGVCIFVYVLLILYMLLQPEWKRDELEGTSSERQPLTG